MTSQVFGKFWNGSAWGGGAVSMIHSQYDRAIQIINVGGVPTLLWSEQDRTDAAASSIHSINLYVSQWNGSAWSAPLGGTSIRPGIVSTQAWVSDGASIATDGSNIWVSFTAYQNFYAGGAGFNGIWIGPQQVQLYKWNGATWAQQGGTGNHDSGASCTGALTGTAPPTYVGGSCTRAYNTSLTIMGGIPYVAFVERTDTGLLQKLWVRSYNGGWSTIGSTFLNRDTLLGWVFKPDITNDGVNLLLAWSEQGNQEPWIGSSAAPGNTVRGQKSKIYAASLSTGGTLTYLGGALNVDTVNGSATHPSITVLNSQPVVDWGEINYGSLRQLYAKQWDGGNWNIVGSATATGGGSITGGVVKISGQVTIQ
jgi:hypothetical protein